MPSLSCLVAATLVLCVGALRSSTGSASSHRTGASATVTPVEKVISLLEQLSKQITEEGANEAAEYDKYACFCKEQASAKTYAIEKSQEKIDKLTATIDALGSSIADLNTAVGALSTDILQYEGDISAEIAARKIEADAYAAADANVTEAVAAVEAAITALKDSKSQLTGTKLNFAQLQGVLAKVVKLKASNKQIAMVSSILENAASPGSSHSYEYQSNKIILLLQDLLVTFKEAKKTLFEDEYRAKAISDKKVLGLENSKKFAEKEKLEKQAIADAKTEEKHAAEEDKLAETNAQTADTEFRTELTSLCEGKAVEWDQRSKARASELSAISEAVELLKSGVNPMYGANKKLVGLAQGKVAQKQLHAEGHQHRGVAPAFFQRSEGRSNTVAVHNVLRMLDTVAGQLHSPRLSALAAKAALQEDHFVKVRGLIKDLIAKLEAEAMDEATQKGFCDTEMSKAVGNRDAEKITMESEAAKIAEEEAKKAQLLKEITTLSEEIAGLAKALNEATELRAAEKKDNEMTIADAKSGAAAVTEAIQVLQQFYGTTLLQYVPPNADREGNTVGDLAPKTSWSGDYLGKTDASKGILGLLQVILDDFTRTIAAVGTAEADAVTKFTDFETKTNTDMTAKKTEKDTKEGEVTTAEAAITTAQDAKMDAERLHGLALEELQKLKAMCVEGEETWAERKAQREKEIAALKQALQILEDWQG
eukprot:CAMPEP_0171099962 /NCGR_PEP_ID=MMETSP0766_2-20121228/52670_1 /TAXON_ID=439317 /ORGANISM="Gambierdiscus australes, Strain CAWD 149" /LENGTH=708 /DNA_ID=CAMNT_0011559701 /DNA_START=54 /DNA_END=2180 /DNA_ORIENTATION=-